MCKHECSSVDTRLRCSAQVITLLRMLMYQAIMTMLCANATVRVDANKAVDCITVLQLLNECGAAHIRIEVDDMSQCTILAHCMLEYSLFTS
jgi:hypothetical protein